MARFTIPDDAKERARHAYFHEPGRTVLEIAKGELGISLKVFYRLAEEWGWPPRDDVRAAARREAYRQARPEAQATLAALPLNVLHTVGGSHGAGAIDLSAVARELGTVVLASLEKLKADQAAGRIEPDRAARQLAALARTLTTAQGIEQKLALSGERGDDDDTKPRSLSELRDELARHLDRIVAEEDALAADGNVDAGGMGGAR